MTPISRPANTSQLPVQTALRRSRSSCSRSRAVSFAAAGLHLVLAAAEIVEHSGHGKFERDSHDGEDRGPGRHSAGGSRERVHQAGACRREQSGRHAEGDFRKGSDQTGDLPGWGRPGHGVRRVPPNPVVPQSGRERSRRAHGAFRRIDRRRQNQDDADVRTNRIHVITRPVNMPFIRKLIAEFDANVEFAKPVTRPLRYISAAESCRCWSRR